MDFLLRLFVLSGVKGHVSHDPTFFYRPFRERHYLNYLQPGVIDIIGNNNAESNFARFRTLRGIKVKVGNYASAGIKSFLSRTMIAELSVTSFDY